MTFETDSKPYDIVVFSSIAHGGGKRRAFGITWQPVVARAR